LEYEDLATGNADMDRFPIRGAVLAWANYYKIEPRYIMGIVHQESRGSIDNYVGDGGGSRGPMQVSWTALKELGFEDSYKSEWMSWVTPGTEIKSIEQGVRYFKRCLQEANNDPIEAFHRYNGLGGALSSYALPVLKWVEDTYQVEFDASVDPHALPVEVAT
jgi:soluble lytic murein transglycosylase-like protein